MESDYALLKRGLGAVLVSASRTIAVELPKAMSGSRRAQHLGIYFAVVTLAELDEDATSQAISNHVGLAVSHVNSILKRLVEIHVLDRESLKTDNRRSYKFRYRPKAEFTSIRQALLSDAGN